MDFKSHRINKILNKQNLNKSDIEFLSNEINLIKGTIFSNLKNKNNIYTLIDKPFLFDINKIINSDEIRQLASPEDINKCAQHLYICSYYGLTHETKLFIRQINHFFEHKDAYLNSLKRSNYTIHDHAYNDIRRIIVFLYTILDNVEIQNLNIDLKSSDMTVMDLLVKIHQSNNGRLFCTDIDNRLKSYFKKGLLFSIIKNYDTYQSLLDDKVLNSVIIAKSLSNNNAEFYMILKSEYSDNIKLKEFDFSI